MFEGLSYTYLLLVFCPLGAVVGSFAHAIVKTINLDGPPKHEGEMKLVSKDLQEKRGIWLGLRLILGGVLGLVIGLYFVGAIQENPATLAKIIALSILVGYSAPKVWEAQEIIATKKLNSLASNLSTLKE